MALLGVLLALTPASASASEFFGVVPQREIEDADYQRMETAKVGAIRIGIHWPALQRSEAASSRIRDVFDDDFGRAAAHGMQVLPFVNNTPEWVRPKEDLPPIETAEDRQAFKNVLRLLVERYGKNGAYWRSNEFRRGFPGVAPRPVKTWQIWNEPSSPASWQPEPDPKEYAELVGLAAEAVRDADPRAKIMLAGIFHDPRHQALHAADYMRRLLDVRGVKSSFDSAAIHPYAEDADGVGEQIKAVRDVLKRKGAGDKALFVTETGWSTGRGRGQSFTTEKGQAKRLKGVFKLALEKRNEWNLGGVYWYSLRDLPRSEPACLFCHETGLFRVNGSPKPSWEAFKSFTLR